MRFMSLCVLRRVGSAGECVDISNGAGRGGIQAKVRGSYLPSSGRPGAPVLGETKDSMSLPGMLMQSSNGRLAFATYTLGDFDLLEACSMWQRYHARNSDRLSECSQFEAGWPTSGDGTRHEIRSSPTAGPYLVRTLKCGTINR